MMQSIQRKTTKVLTESVLFMALLTFVGGYIDAYTYLTRGGVFANNQTANVAKMGITIFNGDLPGTVNALLPMVATVLGAMAAEFFKTHSKKTAPYGWQRAILYIETAVLIAVGFVPTTVPHAVVNLTLSFIAAFQLSTFRSFEGWVHNTTICTGNLRSIGQFVYTAMFVDKSREYRSKTLRYLLVFLSFIVGALFGAIFCHFMQVQSIWVCILPLVFLCVLHYRSAAE